MEITVDNQRTAPDVAIMRAAKLAAMIVLPSFGTEDTTPMTLALCDMPGRIDQCFNAAKRLRETRVRLIENNFLYKRRFRAPAERPR